MIELLDDELVFTFPEVHDKARLDIALKRTFRIPDDGKEYPLPPGFSNSYVFVKAVSSGIHCIVAAE